MVTKRLLKYFTYRSKFSVTHELDFDRDILIYEVMLTNEPEVTYCNFYPEKLFLRTENVLPLSCDRVLYL